MFLDKLRVSSFPDWFPHYAWTVASSADSGFVGSRVYALLGVPCHMHFWQNDRGLLRDTAVTRRCNGRRVRAYKANPGEENSHAAPVGIRNCNLSITSQALLLTSYPDSTGVE